MSILQSIEQLREEYSACSKCPELCNSRTKVVFGTGNPHSKILLIGEAPGFNEDKQGIPFCGMSGQVLTELLNSVDLSREEIFITNTILCRPRDNRNPTSEEVENCRERLDRLIALMQLKVIVTIGNFATERILGKTGINSLRGKISFVMVNNQKINVIPIIHPASYLYSGRNPEMFAKMKADFQTIAKVIDEKKKQCSLGDY